MDVGEDLGQDADRIGGGAAELAGMQVAVGGLDGDFLADQAAQAGRDRRRLAVPHAGVADQAKSAFSSAALASRNGFSDGEPDSSSPSNRIETRQGKRAVHRLVGAAGLDEEHQLALVVGRAAAGDDLAAAARCP